jgi:hypothetical protein
VLPFELDAIEVRRKPYYDVWWELGEKLILATSGPRVSAAQRGSGSIGALKLTANQPRFVERANCARRFTHFAFTRPSQRNGDAARIVRRAQVFRGNSTRCRIPERGKSRTRANFSAADQIVCGN